MQAHKTTQPDTSSDTQELIGHLRKVSLFADIKDDESALACLAKIIEQKTFSPGSSILVEGETGSEMYVLVSGEASVHKSTPEGDKYKVAILNGSFYPCFGESGLLDADARSATIIADTSCRCIVLDRPHFEAFGKESPQWALPILGRIARVVMGRLKKTNHDLSLLYNALVAEIRGQ